MDRAHPGVPGARWRSTRGRSSGPLLLGQALGVDAIRCAPPRPSSRQALAIDPKNARALRGLGFVTCASSFDKAVEAYKPATEADPQNADGWAGLGQSYLGLRNSRRRRTPSARRRPSIPNNASAEARAEVLNQSKADGSPRELIFRLTTESVDVRVHCLIPAPKLCTTLEIHAEAARWRAPARRRT